MPPQSRAQRRRQNARQATRSSNSASQQVSAGLDESVELAEPVEVSAPAGTGPTISLAAPAPRQARQARRPVVRPAPEPVDYTRDYDTARRDILRITLWAGLLIAAMVAIRLTGII